MSSPSAISFLAALTLVMLAVLGKVLPGWCVFLLVTAFAKGLAALGLVLIIRSGLLSFGQGLFYCAGGYGAGLLMLWGGVNDAMLLVLAGGFAVDDAGRARSLEEGVLLGDPLFLHLDIAVEEKAREPAATDRYAVFRQDRAQLGHVHREAAAGFHAGEARDRGLAQAFLQAHVIAEFRKVVVPPGDRGNSKFPFHLIRPCFSNSDALLGADGNLALACLVDRLAV